MKLTDTELKKLKRATLPNFIQSALKEISVGLFPNIFKLLSIMAVIPVTSCEAERSISTLGRLKSAFRSTMSQDRLTGLALMNIHNDISIDVH